MVVFMINTTVHSAIQSQELVHCSQACYRRPLRTAGLLTLTFDFRSRSLLLLLFLSLLRKLSGLSDSVVFTSVCLCALKVKTLK